LILSYISKHYETIEKATTPKELEKFSWAQNGTDESQVCALPWWPWKDVFDEFLTTQLRDMESSRYLYRLNYCRHATRWQLMISGNY